MTRLWEFDRFKDNVALIDEFGGSISYGELEISASALAKAVGKRCLVFALTRNEIGSVIGYASFVNNGIAAVMLSSHLEEGLLQELISTYKPDFLWVPDDMTGRFEDSSERHSAYNYKLLKTPYNDCYPLYDELALLISTSGSTGSPKFVRQSYTNLISNTVSIAEYLKLDDKQRAITTLPMNYVYGLSVINSHFLVGATMLLTDKGIMQKEFWNFFREAQATSFAGVPYTYEILDKLRFYRMDLPSLQTMTQAGGKITPELHEKFALYAHEKGKNFVVMYGAAEATARMGYLPPEYAVEKKGSMGIPIPGGKFMLVDELGAVITEPGITGELVYEGKNVTLGYAEKGEDLILGDERDGRLETGDMARFDSDGFYYIVGRKKRFLKIYGNRVNLAEIENMIKNEFSIETACAGKDDHLYIFITEEGISDKVKAFVVNKTKLNQAAFKVMVLEEIPKNESGKTLYKELTAYYDPEAR
ncbi:MAG: AMP-binding protein [Clostridiales bacterium]|nr:AMP-binding protein [Clostridiales bacterium]